MTSCFLARVAAGFLRGMFRAAVLLAPLYGAISAAAETEPRVPILLYHRLGPVVSDTMTVTTAVFAEQLGLLQQRNYRVIPARQLVDALRGTGAAIPERAVVIMVDDGHRSIYTEMFPLIRARRIPVTLFIYPSAISNAAHALTWAQLVDMKASGLVDVQSHTFWHPNFTIERRRLAPDTYQRFVRAQLARSKAVLEEHLGGPVDLLAWPFGIYDADLMQQAATAGYVAAFSIERRPVSRADNLMALPRYIITDADRGARFEALLSPGK